MAFGDGYLPRSWMLGILTELRINRKPGSPTFVYQLLSQYLQASTI